MTDQGLFATSNFALNVLLARWLTLEEYGAFGVAFALFLLVGRLHQATLQEPMLVFGAGRYKDRLPEYLGVLVYGHFAFAVLSSLVLLLGSLGLALLGSRALAAVMLALSLSGPFILLLWLMRRACYVRLEPRLSASGGAYYMILMLVGAYALYQGKWLSAASALGVMGVSSLVISLWLAIRLRVKLPSLRGEELVRDSFKNHWKYGRWSVANQALSWVPLNIPYLILPMMGGLAAGASFKALMTLVMPMIQGIWSLSPLLLPKFVRTRAEGYYRFDSQVRSAVILFAVGPAIYWLLLGLFHYPLVSWLYGGKYTEHADLLWLLGLCPVFIAFNLVVGHSLRALELPNRLFLAYALAAAAALTVGTGLMYFLGITGAGMVLLISQVITAAVAVTVYRRLRLQPDAHNFPDVSHEQKVACKER